jgi:hypothetical protein
VKKGSSIIINITRMLGTINYLLFTTMEMLLSTFKWNASKNYKLHGFILNLLFYKSYCLNMKLVCMTFVCKQQK